MSCTRLLTTSALVALVGASVLLVRCGEPSHVDATRELRQGESYRLPLPLLDVSQVSGMWSEDWDYCLQAHLGEHVKRHLDLAEIGRGHDLDTLGGVSGAVGRSKQFARSTFDTLRTRLDLKADRTFAWDFGEDEVVTGTWGWDGATVFLLFTHLSGEELDAPVVRVFVVSSDQLVGPPVVYDTGMNLFRRIGPSGG